MIDAHLPPATTNPCGDCPWRRNAIPGWLGPTSAQGWLECAHSDAPVACHECSTYVGGKVDWDDPATRQCRGMASFRANICKSPRDQEIVSWPPDTRRIFATDQEFLDYHQTTNRKGTQ